MQSLRVGVTAGRISPKIRPNRFLGFSRGFHFLVMAAPPPQGQMDIPVIVKRFKSYVLSECRDQLMVIMAHSDGTKHFGVYVRFAFSHG